ncbi:MAG: GNAT family N-acetyltransferase [bacterium]
MIRLCTQDDLRVMYEVINDAAQAYRGIIPADRWHEPYMPMEELVSEIADGVRFWGFQAEGSELVGVMGIQDRGPVHLIRHAYVRTDLRRKGIGSKLLRHLETMTASPILVGTWADAHWAVRFYERHGYRLVSTEEKDRLLRRYWKIPERQVETSVVLANPRWAPSRAESQGDRSSHPGP